MSVKLRLTRMGRKKRPYYRVIAVDSRKKRDGAFIDLLGFYHPIENPVKIKIDAEKTLKWLRVGAQPSDTVRSLLRREGIWHRFHLEKRGLPEAQINELMAKWFEEHKPAAADAYPTETLVKDAAAGVEGTAIVESTTSEGSTKEAHKDASNIDNSTVLRAPPLPDVETEVSASASSESSGSTENET